MRVIIVDSAGAPAPGTLAVRSSEVLPAFRSPVETHTVAFDPSIAIRAHEGSLDLMRPPEQWLELRAVGTAGTAFFLLEPERSLDELRLVLEPVERRVDVLVLAADFVSPASSGSIIVAGRDAVPIDEHGRARIEFGDASELLLLAPGAEVEDGSPHAERVSAPPSHWSFHRVVTLVQPKPRATLDLHIDLEDEQGGDVLALRRIDDGSFAETASRAPLRPGNQILRMRLDHGDYQVVTWPLGRLVAQDDPIVRVRGSHCRAERRLIARSERVELRLTGIESWKLPVHVLPQPADGVLAVGDCGAFLGPWTWRTPKELVVPLSEPQRLVAHGPEGTWISEEPWDGASRDLPVRPATRVDVCWRPTRPHITRAWVELRSAFGDEVLPLRLGVRRESRGTVAGFIGSCFVPRGTLTVVTFFEVAGKTTSLPAESHDLRAARCAISINAQP